MNEGFFTTAQMNSFAKAKPLPLPLNVDFPPEVVKAKAEVDLSVYHNAMVMDIECYVNYFLIKFMRVSDDKIYRFEMTADCPLDRTGIRWILDRYEIITFNGNTFDVPVLKLAMTRGVDNAKLKKAVNYLINQDNIMWRFDELYDLKPMEINTIDLIELAPGILSLKIYGGRLGCKKMQELPYPEDSILTESQMDDVDEYNTNDLIVTKRLFVELIPQIELRRVMSERYKLDLRSKSDAQIAEVVIKSEIEKITKKKLGKGRFEKDHFYYIPPDYIKFFNPKLNEVLDIVTNNPFTLGADGKPISPKEFAKVQVKIGKTTYTTGKGGLHSTEKSEFHVADDKHSIWDWDVASYYPAVILNSGLYPAQLGKDFLTIYQKIVTERLEAKRTKDKVKADTLKILVNGSFGKLGQLYSILYAPDLMLQVTLTGQLSILMLIDKLESRGIPVVSGNTDGIVIKCPIEKEPTMHTILKRWMHETGFELESTAYAGIYSRDINNYIAIKTDGTVKAKGCFRSSALDKSPNNEVCSLAMIEWIKYGVPFEETIRACKDITKFLTVITVKGGAVKNKEYLGKAIRFFHAIGESGAIHYQNNGNKVSMTDGVKPLMDISGPFPKDVDFDWYIAHTKKLFDTEGKK